MHHISGVDSDERPEHAKTSDIDIIGVLARSSHQLFRGVP
jgi:hypothetical protein